jgi:ribonucleoside-diphosphate reductase alpha chain
MQTYTYDEAFDASLKYFDGDDLAASTWINKYCLKDNNGVIYEKSPDDMHKRLAKELARKEKEESSKPRKGYSGYSDYFNTRETLNQTRVYDYLKKFKYIIPQGSIMSILGNPYQVGSLSNCIVVKPPYDSYGGIAYTDQQLAQLMKRRCGVGLDISGLRPTGTEVKNAAKQSTGCVSFMDRFSSTTREVAQGGRRGALMISIDVRHPEVQKFATIKQDLSKVTGANISIRLTDEFMEAVEQDNDFDLRFPIESDNVVATVKAKELWDTVIKSAHSSAEPGLIFWDHQHWYSTSSVYPGFENSSTNPCVTGDALIATDQGLIRIDDLTKRFQDGEAFKVLSFNETTAALEYKEVEAAAKTREMANIIELELEDGRTLKLTPDHKVYTQNRGYIKAIELTEDDVLIEIN